MKMILRQFPGAETEVDSHEFGFRDASRFATIRGEHPVVDRIMGPVRHTVALEHAPGQEPGL